MKSDSLTSVAVAPASKDKEAQMTSVASDVSSRSISGGGSAAAADAKGSDVISQAKNTKFVHWKPGYWDAVRSFLLSPLFQAAVQLVVGLIVVVLFVFVRKMYWTNSCLITTLYIVASLLLSPDGNVGTRLLGAACLLGPSWLGIVMSGTVMTIARTNLDVPADIHQGTFDNEAHRGLVAGIAPIGLLFLVPGRVGLQPPFLWVMGMISCLQYGASYILGEYTFGTRVMWRKVHVHLIENAIIASAVAALCAVLILPTTASDEARQKACEVLRGAGMSLSRITSRMIRRGPGGAITTSATSSAVLDLSAGSATTLELENFEDDELDDQAWLEELHALTTPPPKRPPRVRGKPSPAASTAPVGALRPLLGRVRQCIAFSGTEPPFLVQRAIDQDVWTRLVNMIEMVITRISSLETLMEAMHSTSLGEALLDAPHGEQLLDAYKMTFAKAAAVLNKLAHMLENPEKCKIALSGRLAGETMFGAAWTEVKTEMREAALQLLKHHWGSVRSGENRKLAAVAKVRSWMFTMTAANGIIDAMQLLEKAAQAAISVEPPPPPPAPDAATAKDDVAKSPAAPARPPAPPKPSQVGWLIKLVMLVMCVPIFHNLYEGLAHQLPHALTSVKAFKEMVKNRMFQAGLKYWLTLSILLVLIVALSPDHMDIRVPPAIFAFIACTLAMSERVEATTSKVAIWLVGTTLGGTLGYILMLRWQLATNPFGLTAIMAVFAFFVGSFSVTQFRVLITLTLMTCTGIVLCQYCNNKLIPGCARDHGRIRTYVARILAVMMGAVWAVLVNNLLLPWYTSDWALETMAAALVRATKLMEAQFERFVADGEKAFKASQSMAAGEDGKVAVAAEPAKPAGPPAGPPPLQAQVTLPLVGVQMSLAKDTVMWSRGVLHTPALVNNMLAQMFSLVDRISAIDMSLISPTVSGQFNGWAYSQFIEPSMKEWKATTGSVRAMAEAVQQYIAGDCDAAVLDEAIATVERNRVAVRHAFLAKRKELYSIVSSGSEEQARFHTNPDDSVRFLSFQLAIVRAADRITTLARMVLRDLRTGRDTRAAWIK